MMFTIISIVLSAFEYFLANKFVHISSSIIIKFIVESKDIQIMSSKQFAYKMVYRERRLVTCLARMLNLKREQVERLKPNLCVNGASYTFAIAVDSSHCTHIADMMEQSRQQGTLIKVCIMLYLLPFLCNFPTINRLLYTSVLHI